MSRYQNTVPTNKPPELLAQQLWECLASRGFSLADPQQNIWQKGTGLLVNPQFISFRIEPGLLHVEGWIKFAILPGVYVGEMGVEGLFQVIRKRMLREHLSAVERLANA
jgi:hypothetical protein